MHLLTPNNSLQRAAELWTLGAVSEVFQTAMKRLLLILIVPTFVGCNFEIQTSESKNQFEGAGIVFQIPMETSDASTSPSGIIYKSNRFSATTDGHELWVDGASYGPLSHGDIVDFYAFPEIRVNGNVRIPAETPTSVHEEHQPAPNNSPQRIH